MRRLHASGIFRSSKRGNVCCTAPDFSRRRSEFRPAARATELRAEAERSLRMAQVLAGGGFPEEAPPLIAKAIGIGAAARLAALGEIAAGVSVATPAQICDLVDRGILAAQAEAALSDLSSVASGRTVANVESLIGMGALTIAGLDESNAKRAA